jgi:hypothetical protein
MAKVYYNAYHLKFKLIPKQNGYKSFFAQGIVFEMTPALAEKTALELLNKAYEKEDFEVEVKVHSVVRLRKDFLLYPQGNDTN